MTFTAILPRRFGPRALGSLAFLSFLGLLVNAGDSQPPSTEDVAAQKAKFQAEREQLIKSGAAKQFLPSLMEQADLIAKRAEGALQTKRFSQAVEGYRQARWQLPYAPPELPDKLTRIFGNLRMRHTHQVTSADYSPDGKFLASGGRDGTVRIWDLDNGHAVLAYTGHREDVRGVAYSPDGKLLASIGGKDVRLWDPKTGQDARTLKGTGKYLTSVVFSRDGKYVVAGGDDKAVRIWEVASGDLKREIKDYRLMVQTVAFSQDGSTLAVGVGDGTIQWWQYPKLVDDVTKPYYFSQQDEAGASFFVTFSPDGLSLARCGPDGVKIYGVPKPGSDSLSNPPRITINPPKTGAKANIKDATNWFNCAIFSKDSKVLFTGGTDGVVRLWSAETGYDLGAFRGHNDEIRALVFNASGSQLASTSNDYTIRLWQFDVVMQSREFVGHQGPAWTAMFYPDGQRVVSASADKTVKIWDNAAGKVLKSIPAHAGPATLALISPDGKLILSGGVDKVLKLWNADSGELVRTLEGHTGTITAAAFSSDGSKIVSAGADRQVKVWTTATGKPLVDLGDGKSLIAAVAFHPKDKQIATGGIDQVVRLFNLDGKEERNWIAHSAAIGGLAYSPQGDFLATCGADQLVRVWPLATPGSASMTLVGHNGPLSSVAFRPDGKILASAGADQVIKLWKYEGETFKEAQNFRGHRDWISSVAFSKDGFFLASASVDKAVRVWEITSRDLPLLAEHTGAVEAVAISSDGKLLATGASDRTIKIWDLATGVEKMTLTGHLNKVINLTFTPNNEMLISCGGDNASGIRDNTVRLWNVAAGKQMPRTPQMDEQLKDLLNPPPLAQVSADGKRLCVWEPESERSTKIRIITLATGASEWEYRDTGRNVRAVTFSRDGKRALLGAADGTVKGYDLDAKEALPGGEWKLIEGDIGDICFTNDSNLFVMGTENGTVMLADLAKRATRFSVKGHAGKVYAIAVSADGKRAATLATDNVLKVWDLANGKELRQWALRGAAADRPLVSQLAFTPDGRGVVTANTNTTLYLLEAP